MRYRHGAGLCGNIFPRDEVQLRLAEAVSLEEINTLAGQILGVIQVFHTFRDGRQVEGFGEGKKIADEHLVLLARDDAANEGAVDFDHIDGQCFHMAEGGVAGPEVIQSNLAAQPAHGRDKTGGLLDVL